MEATVPIDLASIQRVMERRLAQLRADPGLEPWLLRAMVDRLERAMVGHIGFHDGPGNPEVDAVSPGAVEFGFTVSHEFRRRGYAYEASRALMEWARRTHGITKFVLSIDPENIASQGLAARLGFRRIGSQLDEIDGLEDVLEFCYPGSGE